MARSCVLETQMQVRAGASACGAHAADALARSHLGAYLDAADREVHVPTFGTVAVANGNLVAAVRIKARNCHNTFGDGVNRRARGATVVNAGMHFALARNGVNAATEGACNMQAVQRVTQAIKDERFTLFGIVSIKGTFRIRIFVTESFMVAHDTAVEFGVNDPAVNPDRILVEGFFEQNAELVAGASQGECHLALEHATDNTHHAAGNAHLEKRAVQGAAFGKRALENGLTAGYRLLNEGVDVTVFCTAEHVDVRRIRGITESLDTARRVYSGVKDLAHAEFGKFGAVLEGKHNLAAFAFVDLHADKHLEKAIAGTNGIVVHNPITRLHLQLFNLVSQGINLCTEFVAFIFQFLDFAFFITAKQGKQEKCG